MFTLLRELIQSVVKILISLAAGGGVGLLAIGIMAITDPDRWDYHIIDRHGPPFGPALLSVGAGLMTSAISMAAMFFPSWWRSTAAGRWLVSNEPPPLPRR